MSEERWQANEETRMAWDQNAAFWDERMGEGNDFVEVLTWPATERLLEVRRGEAVLDIACGNGLTSRRLAALGAHVVGIDFSAEMIARARARSVDDEGQIEYRIVDVTDETALLALGERRFDAALCAMALFDIADIQPLTSALRRLLRPGGRFVFSNLHPCFNSPHVVLGGESDDREGALTTTYWVKVPRYMSSSIARGVAMRGQPQAHLYFHRPLQALLGPYFEAGFVLDGLEEHAFPPDHPARPDPFSWGPNYSEIPPVLVARLRLVDKPIDRLLGSLLRRVKVQA